MAHLFHKVACQPVNSPRRVFNQQASFATPPYRTRNRTNNIQKNGGICHLSGQPQNATGSKGRRQLESTRQVSYTDAERNPCRFTLGPLPALQKSSSPSHRRQKLRNPTCGANSSDHPEDPTHPTQSCRQNIALKRLSSTSAAVSLPRRPCRTRAKPAPLVSYASMTTSLAKSLLSTRPALVSSTGGASEDPQYLGRSILPERR